MKYYIIAGEASGDLHASNLMKALKIQDPDADFRAWGGDLMQQEGAHLVRHIRDISFMGFVEVLAHLRTILGNMRMCKKDIMQYAPDALILVDYPGFNLRIAEFAHQAGLKVFYYISPQVWAWKKGRVHKIRRVVDRMFVILPFEKAFYDSYNYQVDFVGHPLLDAIQQYNSRNSGMEFRKQHQLEGKNVIALLPGSRKMEIKNMLAVMLSVVPDFPEYTFVIAATPDIPEEFYREVIGNLPVKMVVRQTYDLLSSARAALVTSGTATLETGLFGVPEAVCYKGSAISVSIARRVIKIKYISLVNLILDRMAVKEFIQHELSHENLSSELRLLAEDGVYREKVCADLSELKEKLGGSGASEKTADHIIQVLRNSR